MIGPDSAYSWDIEWVDTDGTCRGAWRRIDRTIADIAAQRWLTTIPQSQVYLYRRRPLDRDDEILELVQILRANRADDDHI